MTIVLALCVLALVAIPFVLHALDLIADYGEDMATLADIPDEKQSDVGQTCGLPRRSLRRFS